MSVLINGLIKWREEKMERAGTGQSSQWQKKKGGGQGKGKWMDVTRVTTGEENRFWKLEIWRM